MRRSCISLFVLVGGLVTAAAPCFAGADDLRGFWQSDAAKNWDFTPQGNSSKSIVFKEVAGPKNAPKAPVSAQITVPAAEQQPPANRPDQFTTTVSAAQAPAPQTRDAILSAYGDPSKDTPIVPKGDANPEFRGMAAALAIGDKDLAFQYARAHVRHLKNLQDFISSANEYQSLAMEVEGMEAENNDPAAMSPERKQLAEIIAKAKEEKAREDAARKLPAGSETLIDEEGNAIPQHVSEASLNKPLNVPVDPEGKVKVLLFFSSRAEATRPFVIEGLKLAKQFASDPRVSVTGFIHERMDAVQLEIVRNGSGITFPLKNGEALEQQLKISVLPAVVFVAQSTKAIHTMTGVQSVEELSKVVRLMQGGN